MAFFKEDGSLDVEKINRLSLEERFDAIGSLTKNSFKNIYLNSQLMSLKITLVISELINLWSNGV